ncbi:heterokaryon incompatibility protein-domain-containing protein [Hypoxylon trugodes]|uniref:heterokaryon incompatibility protein-domain-containing protein n=1 Tax=Hypoxylon trugodes TaxID=326681 RepID=UPI002198DA14|nr:heterokaryon incompatibility protein-domain-containing protein [Hypoxylon trugodes]KAI1389488.1 heterokaryon incompatibility protein-domain-containing protein [Hypoxylon trugodes]
MMSPANLQIQRSNQATFSMSMSVVSHSSLSLPFKPKEPAKYACLSYCWGESKDVIKTTPSNLESHKNIIPLSSMPKTIQDAVRVCRGLGLHLWVDSLCIIQDDGDLWLKDASDMDRIYLNSHLTIAALEPSSCEMGFLGKQKFGLPEWQHTLRGAIVRPEPDEDLVHSLDKRGWCLQETMLSQRKLYFNGNEMSWEYLCRKVYECGHHVWPMNALGHGQTKLGVVQLGTLLKESFLSTPVPKPILDPIRYEYKRILILLGSTSLHGIEGAPTRFHEI